MRNVSKKLVDSWWALLNGSISVPVYIESVPSNEDGNYFLIRMEGETDVEKNSSTWIKEVVLIGEVVTVFDANELINTSTCDDIDNEVGVLLINNPVHDHNLAAQAGMKINSVTEETTTYLQEDDGEKKYYRKITRYNHLITIQS